MESVNGTLKVECVHDMHFETRAQARCAIVEYIGYYNTECRHSALGYISPAEFERRWRAGLLHPNAIRVVAKGGTALPTAGRFRFVASDRTSRPWITLFVLRGVHVTGSSSLSSD
jgi:hypothetical protein